MEQCWGRRGRRRVYEVTVLYCLSSSRGGWRKEFCFKGNFSISKCICAPNWVLAFHQQEEGEAGSMVTYQEHQLPQREDPVETPTRRTHRIRGRGGGNRPYIRINAHTHTANRKWPPLFLIPLLYSHHKKNYETQLFIQHFQKFNRPYSLKSEGQALVSDTPNETPSENRIWLRFSRQMKGFFPLSEETQVCKVYRH